MDNNEKHTDEFFRASFDQFEVKPPGNNWKEIEEEMESQLDKHFHNELSPLEVKPKARVWNEIKDKLPLHPGMRRYISWMTRVAAVLIIGMLLTILADRQQKGTALSKLQQDIDIPPATHLENNIVLSTSGEFVFEVKKKSRTSTHPRKYNKEEEDEIKNMLQFILDDTDDIAELADQEIIDESLQAATYLPDGVALVIPENDKNTEPIPDIQFDVKIPLIIVETEQEAADLIQIYESSHQATKQVVGVQ